MVNRTGILGIGLVLMFGIGSPLLKAAIFQNQSVTKAAPPSSGCTVPVAALDFLTADSSILNLNGVKGRK